MRGRPDTLKREKPTITPQSVYINLIFFLQGPEKDKGNWALAGKRNTQIFLKVLDISSELTLRAGDLEHNVILLSEYGIDGSQMIEI